MRGYRFGPFDVGLNAGEVRKDGVRLKLQEQPFQILVALLERPAELVTRKELQKRLWPNDTFVDFEQGLNVAVKKLRDALGDSAESPRFIETLSRRGYRFVAPVEVLNGAVTLQAAGIQESPKQKIGKRKWAWWVMSTAAVAVLAVGGLLYLRRPVIAFQPRDWVLIASFENRTGEAVLEGTLEYALARELSNSQFVNVVSRERIEDTLKLMKKPGDTRVTPELGSELCLRDGGIRAFLTGRVEKLGSRYVLSAELMAPAEGRTVAGLSEDAARQEELLPAVRRLSNRVREILGEKLARMQQTGGQLEKVTTSSLRALQLYSQARQLLLVAGGEQASVELLRKAIQEDPEFASAHIQLAALLFDHDKRVQHAKRAFELSNKTTDRERMFIEGRYYQLTAQDRKAISAYEVLLSIYPDEEEATNALTSLYLQVGRSQHAVVLAARSAEMRPNDFGTVAAAAHSYLVWGGDLESARVYVQRARALRTPEQMRLDPWFDAFVELFPAHEYWVRREAGRALAEVDRIAKTIPGRSGPNRNIHAACTGLTYLTLGRLQAAEMAFQNIPGAQTRAFLLAAVAFARSDQKGMRREMEEYVKLTGASAAIAFPTGLMIRSGLVAAAEKQIATREKEHFSNHHLPSLLGELALAQGKRAEAIRLLEEGNLLLQQSGSAGYFLATESLADALQQKGDMDRALDVLQVAAQQNVRTFVMPRPAGYFWLRTAAKLARFYRMAGRVADAEKIETELRGLLAFADPDHAILVSLRQTQSQQTPRAAR